VHGKPDDVDPPTPEQHRKIMSSVKAYIDKQRQR
jgi:hypothetical protein